MGYLVERRRALLLLAIAATSSACMFFRSLDELSSGAALGDGGRADRDGSAESGSGDGSRDGGPNARWCDSLATVDADFYRCIDFDDGNLSQTPLVSGGTTWALEPDDASLPYALVYRVKDPDGGVNQGLFDTYTNRTVVAAETSFAVKLDYPDGAPPDDESASGIARGEVYTYVDFDRKRGSVTAFEQLQPSDGGALVNGRIHASKVIDLHAWHRVRLACNFANKTMSLWVDDAPVFIDDSSDFGVVQDGTAFRLGLNFSYGLLQPSAYHFDDVVYRATFQ